MQFTLHDKSITNLVESWLSDMDIQEQSRARYRLEFDVFLRWLQVENIQLLNVRKGDVIRFKAHLAAKHKASSVRNYISTLNLFYKWGAMHNIHNPMHGIRRPSPDRSMKRVPLTVAQIDQLYVIIRSGKSHKALRDYAMVVLMIECGLRRIEISRLTIGDVQQEDGRWYIHVWGKGSSQADKDKVELSPRSIEAIEAYLTSLSDGYNMEDKDPLFVSKPRQSLLCTTVSVIVKQYMAQVVTAHGYSCHSLRHTGAMLVWEDSKDIYRVREFLRHNSISTTQLYLKAVDHFRANDGYIPRLMNKKLTNTCD